MATRSDIREGMIVRSLDGEKLGKIVRLFDDGFLIEKGFFFPHEYDAGYEEIRSLSGDEVILSIGKNELESYRERRVALRRGAGATGVRGTEAPLHERGVSATEETRIPLAEEELIAEKRKRQAGEVEIHKDVVTEEKSVKVPVTREEVRVERKPVTEPLRAGEPTFEKGTVRVPVEEEEVEVTKRPVVREEVRVSKERQTEERTASGTVRRETADIDKRGDVDKKKW